MRALLSAVGTRGDVQPIVALGVQLRALGHNVRLCVPPNFVDWVHGLGFDAKPVGVEMRAPPKNSAPLTPEQLEKLRASMPDLISDQFESVGAAIDDVDVILGANAHQYAARSIAELHRIPYMTALYAPVAIPSPDHAPPPSPGQAWTPGGDATTNLAKWNDVVAAWNARALERVNHNRGKRGLAAIDDVLRFNITDRPWLATDPALAPAPSSITSTGAWILEDKTPLSPELETFLAAGDAPLYFGFGSMPAPQTLGRALVDAARAVGRRAVIAKGWAELSVDDAADCIAIGDVNQQALFPRCAVVVHHGGAGTTATAARAGVAQVVAPMFSDQFYWASRVRALAIGSSVSGALTTDALTPALRDALADDVATRARSFVGKLEANGARVAAERLVAIAGGQPSP